MSEIFEKETLKQAVKPPSMWNVVFVNDDFTTMEFVMECLIYVFSKTESQAATVMLAVHQTGKGVVGQYTKDIAITKQTMAIEFARMNEHPLQILLEEAN
jgi:ATP-dependent Clp protease adaptor protein ClpS